MTLAEKYLYHQIHPLKLTADWAAGLGCLYPLWQHDLLWGLLVLLVPPPLASLLIVRFADVERLKRSAFGRYIEHYMTRAAEAVRLIGMVIMAAGAWFHSPVAILVGLLLIVLAWLRGVLLPSASVGG
jgi:hypothetical protein